MSEKEVSALRTVIVSGREGFDSSPFDWSVSDSFELSTCLPIRARMSSKGSESGAASLITEAVVLRWVGVIEAPFEEKGFCEQRSDKKLGIIKVLPFQFSQQHGAFF